MACQADIFMNYLMNNLQKFCNMQTINIFVLLLTFIYDIKSRTLILYQLIIKFFGYYFSILVCEFVAEDRLPSGHWLYLILYF